MATNPPDPTTFTEAPITSIQPGGGAIFEIELAWGRLRRGLLRRLRPGYVQAMLAKKQGTCPNCPHDIIDARDLKPFRNVCGHWFRPEDDRFRWRDKLRFARPGLAELTCFTLAFLTITGFTAILSLLHWVFWLFWLLPLGLWLFVVSFFRDPVRTIPTEATALVSPADGTITDIDEVDQPDFPGGRALRVGIFLSVFNVHVNRIPWPGRVTAIRYFPGAFLDARSSDCPQRNEQLWLDLQDSLGRPLRVKQISGAIARRIVCTLKVGEMVTKGEKLGMIKFGSRTELYLPLEMKPTVLVEVGQSVAGGSTVLMKVGA